MPKIIDKKLRQLISSRLREAQIKAGYRTDLALCKAVAKIGRKIYPGRMGEILKAKRDPQIEDWNALRKALNVSPDWIFGDSREIGSKSSGSPKKQVIEKEEIINELESLVADLRGSTHGKTRKLINYFNKIDSEYQGKILDILEKMASSK